MTLTRLDRGIVLDSTREIRVVIADRRQLIADAIASLVAEGDRLSVVGVISGELSAAAIAAARPDVVLLGLGGDLSGVRPVIELLRVRSPQTHIALIADALSPSLIGCVLQRGLGGVLLTSRPAEELVASIVHIARGEAILPSGWQAQAAGRENPLDALSERQLEVLRLLSEGHSYEEIGGRLFISVNTVKFHMRSIFERLGVHNRIAAVRLYTDAPSVTG